MVSTVLGSLSQSQPEILSSVACCSARKRNAIDWPLKMSGPKGGRQMTPGSQNGPGVPERTTALAIDLLVDAAIAKERGGTSRFYYVGLPCQSRMCPGSHHRFIPRNQGVHARDRARVPRRPIARYRTRRGRSGSSLSDRPIGTNTHRGHEKGGRGGLRVGTAHRSRPGTECPLSGISCRDLVGAYGSVLVHPAARVGSGLGGAPGWSGAGIVNAGESPTGCEGSLICGRRCRGGSDIDLPLLTTSCGFSTLWSASFRCREAFEIVLVSTKTPKLVIW